MSGNDGGVLSPKAYVAVRNYVNGMTISAELSGACAGGHESRDCIEQIDGDVCDLPRFQDAMLESKYDTEQCHQSDAELVKSVRMENNEEELPVQTIIAISRNIDGIIALSLEKTVKQLCPVQPESVNDDQNSGDPSQFPATCTSEEVDIVSESVVSDDVHSQNDENESIQLHARTTYHESLFTNNVSVNFLPA